MRRHHHPAFGYGAPNAPRPAFGYGTPYAPRPAFGIGDVVLSAPAAALGGAHFAVSSELKSFVGDVLPYGAAAGAAVLVAKALGAGLLGTATAGVGGVVLASWMALRGRS